MVISMDRWRGKVAVVTGASSGIGEAIAEKLVEEGMEVVGLARRCERMKVLQKKVEGKKGKFHPIKCDVSQESDILKAFVHITENIGPIHVLVNNAGAAHASRLVDGETEKFKNMLMVNVLGLCIATREAIKDMKKNNVDGHIFHMNSVTGHYVPPILGGISVYPATKHAITALTETLRQELTTMKSKIRITSISPGVVLTDIFEVSGVDFQQVKDTFNKGEDLPYLKSEDVADTVVFALSTPPHVNGTSFIHFHRRPLVHFTTNGDFQIVGYMFMNVYGSRRTVDQSLGVLMRPESEPAMVISMDRWRGKVAIVTGASSGIGAAIAEKLVEEGMEVVGLARRCERMQLLQKKVEGRNGKFYSIKCDVSQESDILEAFTHITMNIGPIHVLVNNAGVALGSRLVDGETEKFKNMLMVNVLGLCIATREAIKDMKKNNVDGHIIHINSILGHYVAPAFEGIGVYAATKHAVTGLTETLRQELTTMKSKIRITSISPGVVLTDLFAISGLDLEKLKDTINKGEDLPTMKPEDIADTVVFVLSTPPHVNISELTIKPVNEPF